MSRSLSQSDARPRDRGRPEGAERCAAAEPRWRRRRLRAQHAERAARRSEGVVPRVEHGAGGPAGRGGLPGLLRGVLQCAAEVHGEPGRYECE